MSDRLPIMSRGYYFFCSISINIYGYSKVSIRRSIRKLLIICEFSL
nr:MAG TPA: hypothetical protein [Caudoviricetes sp.]